MVEKKDKEIDSFLRGVEESRRGGYEDRYKGDDFKMPRKVGGSTMMGAAFVVFLLVVVAGVAWIVRGTKNGGSDQNVAVQPASGPTSPNMVTGEDGLKYDQGKYQAVFLTNGQVYFGKVVTHSLSYVELTDIYYLQVKPVLQQGDNNSNTNSSQQQTELSLVKLGNELHGPQDRMMINKDQVVFLEDLKDDSKVTDAIKRYKAQPQDQSGQTAPASQTTPPASQTNAPASQTAPSKTSGNKNANSTPNQTAPNGQQTPQPGGQTQGQ